MVGGGAKGGPGVNRHKPHETQRLTDIAEQVRHCALINKRASVAHRFSTNVGCRHLLMCSETPSQTLDHEPYLLRQLQDVTLQVVHERAHLCAN